MWGGCGGGGLGEMSDVVNDDVISWMLVEVCNIRVCVCVCVCVCIYTYIYIYIYIYIHTYI